MRSRLVVKPLSVEKLSQTYLSNIVFFSACTAEITRQIAISYILLLPLYF